MYELQSHVFATPRGVPVEMAYRADTNDWNTTWSCLNEDEYHIGGLFLTGRALDIGGYTGGVTVALAVDNPELHVTVIEPVPSNVELIARNVEANGISERVTIIAGAVGAAEGTTTIHYGYTGTELAEHHAFVGNMSLVHGIGPDNCPAETPHVHVEVPTYTLTALTQVPWSFCKIDCEGGEWDFFGGLWAKHGLLNFPYIVGEWHPSNGHTQADFTKLLKRTHNVTYDGPEAGPQEFTAVLR